MIIKSLGLSQLIYSASTLDIPEDVISTVRTKLFSFLWKNKKDRIKWVGLYQDTEKGGIRVVDTQTMFKALKLSWIPRLLKKGSYNWKTMPDYYLRKSGGLNFLLKCNYDTKHFPQLPMFLEIFWPTSMNLKFSMVMIKHKTSFYTITKKYSLKTSRCSIENSMREAFCLSKTF